MYSLILAFVISLMLLSNSIACESCNNKLDPDAIISQVQEKGKWIASLRDYIKHNEVRFGHFTYNIELFCEHIEIGYYTVTDNANKLKIARADSTMPQTERDKLADKLQSSMEVLCCIGHSFDDLLRFCGIEPTQKLEEKL